MGRKFSFESSLSSAAGLVAVVMCLTGLFVVFLDLLGLEWSAVLRDPSLSDAPLAGVVSNAGVSILLFAGTIGLIASLTEAKKPLAAISLFCLIFAIDDGLMLHERLGGLEFVIYPIYGAGLAYAWRGYTRQFDTILVWPLILVFAAFVIAAIFDQLWNFLHWFSGLEFIYNHRGALYALEDIPKFAGIVLLSLCVINEALDVFQTRQLTDDTNERF